MTLTHSSITNQHFTPPHIIDRARVAMGSIDLDPCSNEKVNQDIVKASQFYTEADDGLSRKWWGNVFINPPGGKNGNQSRQTRWLREVLTRYERREIDRAVFLSFNVESFWRVPQALKNPLCFPSGRLKFYSQDPRDGELKQGQWSEKQQKWSDSPQYSNLILFLPHWRTWDDDLARFREQFSNTGAIVYNASVDIPENDNGQFNLLG